MEKITTLDELRRAIRDLEHQNYVNEQQLRNRVTGLADRLKPANLLRHLFGQLFSHSDVKTSLLRMAAGVATSFLVKKFFRKGLSAKKA